MIGCFSNKLDKVLRKKDHAHKPVRTVESDLLMPRYARNAMYEKKSEAPIPVRSFVTRLLLHTAAGLVLLIGSLILGIVGYFFTERLGLVDAFLNSAMVLVGMGPIDSPQTIGGKLFAGFFALYSGLIFIVTSAILLSPVVHRILHRFHWEAEEPSPTSRPEEEESG